MGRKKGKKNDLSVSHAAEKFIKGRNLLIKQAMKKLNSLNWQAWAGDYTSFCKAQIRIKEEIQALQRDIQFAKNMVARDEDETTTTKAANRIDIEIDDSLMNFVKQRTYEVFGLN